MFASQLLSAAVLAFAPALAIPPENFGFPSAPNDTALTVSYRQPNGSVVSVAEAEMFGVNVTKSQPTLAVDTRAYRSLATYTGQYLILMVDPDVPMPQNHTRRFYLHWLQPYSAPQNSSNGVRVLRNQTNSGVPYTAPAPPTDSDAHRYIIYAFQQPPNFTMPQAFMGYSASNRSNFNVTEFIDATYLGQPAAAQYFYVSSKPAVPGNYAAPAGATYPSGNGGQVDQGNPSPTGSMPTGTNAAAKVNNAWAPLAGLLGAAAFML